MEGKQCSHHTKTHILTEWELTWPSRKIWYLMSKDLSLSPCSNVSVQNMLFYSLKWVYSSIVGWTVLSKIYTHLRPQHLNLFEIRVFTSVIKVRILRWDHPGVKRALNPVTVLTERTHTHPWKSKGKIAPQNFQREASPAATLISNFWPPELRENKSLWFYAT